ncbi:MAG: phospholipase D-like domain-containing protein [Gaiellaceae bacterium]
MVASLFAASASATGSASPGLGRLIIEPDQGYTRIYTLLGSAKQTLDMTMYEFRDSDAEKVLIDDAARGVAVRVLLDKQYHGGPYNQPLFNDLVRHGIKVQWASTQVAITHQKSFVIDGKKAVIMTGNLTSPYYATSRDFAVVDSKKSDVNAIEAVFMFDWANSKGVAPTGADLVWSPGSQASLVSLIGSAKHTLLVENEEMAAPLIVSALEDAAKRGVTVQVVMTDSPSWKTNFDALKAAGAHVRTYKSSSKTLYIHAKIIEADASRVFLGSENFSVGSLQRNRELGLITTSAPILRAVKTTFASDYAGATPW